MIPPRVSLRLQRFELIALALAVGAWTAPALFIAWRLGGFAAEFPDCFGVTVVPSDHCDAAALQFALWDQTAEALLWLVLAWPLLLGVVLGSPIVAREIEQQTAQLAWSYSLSRVHWLIGRTIPIAVAGVILLSVIALAGESLEVARLARDDLGFQRYDQRGVLVVVRGLVALSCAILVGAWLGRTLPAILAGSALSALLVFGTVVGLDAWRRAEGVIVEQNSTTADQVLLNAMILEPVAILPDGTVVSDRNADLPIGVSFNALRIIPATQYWTWVGREGVMLALLATVSLVIATVVVKRRRPL